MKGINTNTPCDLAQGAANHQRCEADARRKDEWMRYRSIRRAYLTPDEYALLAELTFSEVLS